MRPLTKLDWNQIGDWICKGAKAVDIAERLGICRETLYIRCQQDLNIGFSTFSAQKKATMRMRILELQLELAEEKNMPILIWLGKQYCGQREPEPKISEHTKAEVLQFIEDQKKEKVIQKEKTSEYESKAKDFTKGI